MQITDNNRTWALTRMCLVDSYSPGRIIEFDVAGGAALAGRNGEGKTTLLSILPLFHGETPSRLVRKGANRQGFVKHYLKHASSFIVFEYVRGEGDVCMSVFYANADGTSVNQRFVRAPFDPSLFVSEDGKTFLPSRELKERLSVRRIESSNVNDLSGYRNVLHATPQNREQAQDCQLYSITPPGHPVSGVERIINGMFQRTTNFSDIASIVVRNVQEGEDPIQLKTKRDQVEWWVRDYDAYAAVMAAEHRWRTAETAQMDVTEARGRLGRMIARLDGFITYATAERAMMDDAVKEIAKVEVRIQDEDVQRLQKMRAGREALVKETRQLERESKIHEEAIERHLKDGMEQSSRDVDSMPILERTISELSERKRILEGQAGDISTSYDRMAVDKRSRAAEEAEALRKTADARRQQANQAMADIDRRAAAARSAHQSAAREEERAMDARVEQATDRNATAKQQVSNPTVPAEVQKARDDAAASHSAARERHDAARDAMQRSENALRKAKESLHTAERRADAAKTRHSASIADLSEAKAIMQGPDGSILRFARDHAPASLDVLTRVLPTEILLRADLTPTMSDGRTDAVFGISFEVSRLPEDPASDLQKAGARVEAAERAERDAASNQNEAEESLRKAGAFHAAAMQALRPMQAEEATARALLQEEAELSRRTRETYDDARTKAAGIARQHAAIAAGELQRAQEARDVMRKAHAEAAARTDQHHEDEKSILRAEISSLETSLAGDVSRIEMCRDEAVAALLRERDEALLRNGVDVNAVRAIESEIQRLRRERTRIAAMQKDVNAWRHWNEVEPPKQEHRLLRIAEIGEELPKIDADVEALEIAIRRETDDLRKRRDEIEGRRATIVADEARVTERIKAIEQFRTGGAAEWRAQDDLGSTLRDAGSAKTRIHESEQRRDSALRDLDAAFAMHPSSGPFSYRHDGGFETDGGGDRLTGFRAWFETRHAGTRSRISDTAETLSRNISVFRDGLLEFRRLLLAFNRQIQERLADIAVFESLTGLEIEIRPALDNLEYWPRIQEVADATRAMVAASTERGSMPDPAFRDAVASLLPLWNSGTAIRADLASLIHISGKVADKGVVKTFQSGMELGDISSNGLSYLVLASILTAFVDRIRKDSPTTIVWAVDELRDLDAINAAALVAMLKAKRIEIVSAFTDVDSGIMRHFANRYAMRTGRRIQRVLLQDRRARGVPHSGAAAPAQTSEPLHVL